VNDEGKKVKITRRIKRTLQKSVVEHAVAERQKWAKFGKERGNKPGPDGATTTVGEAVSLKLSVGNKVLSRPFSFRDSEKNYIPRQAKWKQPPRIQQNLECPGLVARSPVGCAKANISLQNVRIKIPWLD